MKTPMLALTIVAVVIGTAPVPLQAQVAPGGTIAHALRDQNRDYVPDQLDDTVTVRGRVVSPVRHFGASVRIDIEDDTRGVTLQSRDSLHMVGLRPGDVVIAAGAVHQNLGREEIRVAHMRRIAHGAPVRAMELTVSQLLSERYAGRLVRVSGRISVTQDPDQRVSIMLIDTTGRIPVDVPNRFLADPRLVDALNKARSATITGLASQEKSNAPYNSGYELVPRELQHIELVPAPPYRIIGLSGALIFFVFLAIYLARQRRTAETEKRRAERYAADLKVAEAEQRALIEAMRDVVLVMDAEGRYVKIPSTASDLLYAPSQELVGRTMHEVMPAEAADAFLRVIREALAKQDAVRMEYNLPIQGRTVWFSAVVSPLSSNRVVWVSRDVTAQKDAEEATRASEERYRLLFELNPMPMWVYDKETLAFLSVNSAAIKQYGYSREEFLSMTIADVRPEQDVARLRRIVQNSPAELHQLEGWQHKRKNGQIIEVDITAHPFEFDGRDAELVLANDVTLRRRAEAELRESRDLLRAVVDESPLAIISLDQDRNVNRWNPAAERLLGWTSAEIVGRSYVQVIPEEPARGCSDVLNHVREGGSLTNVETHWTRKDGSRVDVSLSLAALHDNNGEMAGVMAIVADITEQKRIESQLRQAQKMEAVGQLAGGVAHDFNNILTAIMSYGQMLLEELPAGGSLQGDVIEITRAAERAQVLTRQLLAFSRQQVVQPQVLSLKTVADDLQKLLRRLIREDIDLRLLLEGDNACIEADRGQIEQVIVNLVVNARDAMPAGGSLTIKTDTATIDGQGHVVLTVSDTGVGMTEEVKERIFEPFFTTKEAGRGTGLGLATVYGIVNQSGGSVRVLSEPGIGSTFDIYLPQVAAPNVAPTATAAFVMGTRSVQSDGGLILLVEDEETVRAVATRVLTRSGYEILEAKTGKEALDIFRAKGAEIDLVITDMVMPEMGGIELATRLRAQRADVHLLFISGYSRDVSGVAALLDDRNAYLEKPFAPADLLSKVRELLESARVASHGNAGRPEHYTDWTERLARFEEACVTLPRVA